MFQKIEVVRPRLADQVYDQIVAAINQAMAKSAAEVLKEIKRRGVLTVQIARKASSSPQTTISEPREPISASIASATAPRRCFSIVSRKGRAPRRG